MATSRLWTTLRRVAYRSQDFNKCRVTGDLRYVRRAFSKKSIVLDEDDGAATAKKQRPKTEPVPKITLLSPDNSITVTVLEDAQRLAKRRKLTLVKVSDLDSKTERPTYKLVSTSVFLEEAEENVETNDKNKQKSTKLLYISAKIAEHDLLTKTRKVQKLLNKGNKVKVVITMDGTSEDKAQRIIEDAVKNDGSIQRMPSKKNVVLLLISPTLNKNKDSVDNNKEATGAINQNNNT